jgi:hypothetical protein
MSRSRIEGEASHAGGGPGEPHASLSNRARGRRLITMNSHARPPIAFSPATEPDLRVDL